MRFRVIDIETCGEKPPAKVIEIGRIDIVDGEIRDPFSTLFNPGCEIPAEAKAVHHITEADVEHYPPVEDSRLRAELTVGQPDVLVAHNAEFEKAFLGHLVPTFPWLCTYKTALWLWPDLNRHSNQVLRYTFCPDIDRERATPAHRALPDAFATAELLRVMLKTTTIEQMIAWTNQPRHMPRMTFGKYGPKDGNKGLRWEEIDGGYLDWMLKQKDMDADAVWHARRELERRRRPTS
jgi:exodeoxyribonuclease X